MSNNNQKNTKIIKNFLSKLIPFGQIWHVTSSKISNLHIGNIWFVVRRAVPGRLLERTGWLKNIHKFAIHFKPCFYCEQPRNLFPDKYINGQFLIYCSFVMANSLFGKDFSWMSNRRETKSGILNLKRLVPDLDLR